MILCPKCGSLMSTSNLACTKDSALQNAMSIQRRVRKCEGCGITMSTTEISSAELQSLRHKAFLFLESERLSRKSMK